MTSLFKKLSIFIKIGVIERYGVCLISFKIVDRIRRQSSSASCELCSHRRRRRDKTVSSRRRRQCVLGLTMATLKRCEIAKDFSAEFIRTLIFHEVFQRIV